MIDHDAGHGALLVAVVAVAVITAGGVPLAAATQTNTHVSLGYDTTPADSKTVAVGSAYTHEFAVQTNATDGPLVFTVYYNRSADITYSDHTVEVKDEEIDTQLDISNVTVNGRELTRVQVTNRSMRSVPGKGERTFDVDVVLSVPAAPTNEIVYTGGTHGPSGKTLSLEETDVTAAAADITPTDIALSDGSPTRGDTVQIDVTVANRGGLDAGSVPVAVEINGTDIGNATATLPANSEDTISVDWNVSATGPQAIRVNTSSSVPDLNAANMTRSRVVSVATQSTPTPTPTPEDDGGGGGGGSGGGGGGGGGFGPSERQLYPGVTATPNGTHSTEIVDEDSLTPGKTLEFDRFPQLSVVERVTLLSDEPGSEDSAIIREYRTPPGGIATDLSADLDLDRVEVTDAVELTVDFRKIEVQREVPDQISSTVTLSVARDEINDPESVFIAYRIENGSWERVDTQVTERDDQQVTLKATVESSAVLAVAETLQAQTPPEMPTPTSTAATPTPQTPQPETEGTVSVETATPLPEETAETVQETPATQETGALPIAPVGGVIVLVGAVVAALVVLRRRELV